MNRFSDSVAVVTGGASGIGADLVELWVSEGGCVVIADVQDDLGRALAADLGDRAVFVHTDVTVDAEVAAAVDAAVERWGRLDLMCNNAAVVGADLSIEHLSADDFRTVFDVVVLGTIHGTKHAARVMRARGEGGAIVNISSTASQRGGVGPHLYTAAKHAIVGLTRSTGAELVSDDIRVNTVAPGGVATPFGARHVYGDPSRVEELSASIAARSPMSRGSSPRDISEAVAYFASDASGYVVGQTLVVDAGFIVAPPRKPGD